MYFITWSDHAPVEKVLIYKTLLLTLTSVLSHYWVTMFELKSSFLDLAIPICNKHSIYYSTKNTHDLHLNSYLNINVTESYVIAS